MKKAISSAATSLIHLSCQIPSKQTGTTATSKRRLSALLPTMPSEKVKKHSSSVTTATSVVKNSQPPTQSVSHRKTSGSRAYSMLPSLSSQAVSASSVPSLPIAGNSFNGVQLHSTAVAAAEVQHNENSSSSVSAADSSSNSTTTNDSRTPQFKTVMPIKLSSDREFLDHYTLVGDQQDPLGFGTFGQVHICVPSSRKLARMSITNARQRQQQHANINTNSRPVSGAKLASPTKRASSFVDVGDSRVAVKVMAKDQQPFYLREIEMLSRVKGSKHCVQLIEVFESPRYVYLVTELLMGGDLFDFIVEHNVGIGNLSITQTMDIAKQMLVALEEVHLQNFAHLDVKPENFVFRHRLPENVAEIDQAALEKAELVLIDFGASQPFKLRPYAKERASYMRGADEIWLGDHMNKLGGTASYLSPEVFLHNRFSSRSDMWSLGVSLYMMLTGQRPFEAETELALKQLVAEEASLKHEDGHRDNSVFSKLIEQGIPKGVVELLVNLTEPEPENRYSSTEALRVVNELLNSECSETLKLQPC